METKWTDAGKVLAEKSLVKELGLNFVGTSEPTNPEEGQSWYDSTNNIIKFYDGSNWISAGQFGRLKRTLSEANGPYLNELIDSKNGITNNTATVFLNITVPNKNLGALILIEYLLNTDNSIVYRTGQLRVNVARDLGEDSFTYLEHSIAAVDTPDSQQNLFSTDTVSAKIYQHSGFSATISDSFSSPFGDPYGIIWSGNNIFSADYDSDKIYRHSGFSATITDSFSSPSTGPRGLALDGIHVISTDSESDKIYKHSGFSTIISDSFSSPSTLPEGIVWDGSNILSADDTTNKIYQHSGFSATI